jgi:hypothetical protein
VSSTEMVNRFDKGLQNQIKGNHTIIWGVGNGIGQRCMEASSRLNMT